MGKTIKLTLLISLIAQVIFAQQVRNLTVEQAVSTALANVEEIKNLKLDEEIQVQKNKEVIGHDHATGFIYCAGLLLPCHPSGSISIL
ncbi:MAG: hypothetical protein IPH94_10810 [Saprospiraceae bacterium]|nr:hypothetical protein [Saprospiraceae bacterium]